MGMRSLFSLLVTAFSIQPVLADVPDNVMDSGIHEITQHAGDDSLIDVVFC